MVIQSDAHVAASSRLLRRVAARLSLDPLDFNKSLSAIEQSLESLAQQPRLLD
jgi:hypothetical protein